MWRMNGNSNGKAKASWLAAMVLMTVARMFGEEPAKAESVRHDILEGQPQRVIVVSLEYRKLALMEDGKVVKVYPVAVGAQVSPSPKGKFQVVNRLKDPTYYHPGKVIGPGAQNPLGSRWMGLNQKGYGIHGTNEPKSVGRAASHGCIRMGKADLEDLFERVKVGDTVEIRGERDQEATAIFGNGSEVVLAQTLAVVGQVGGGN